MLAEKKTFVHSSFLLDAKWQKFSLLLPETTHKSSLTSFYHVICSIPHIIYRLLLLPFRNFFCCTVFENQLKKVSSDKHCSYHSFCFCFDLPKFTQFNSWLWSNRKQIVSFFFLFENETFCSDFPTLCSFMQKHKIEYYVMYLNICKTFFAKIYIFCGLWIYSSWLCTTTS